MAALIITIFILIPVMLLLIVVWLNRQDKKLKLYKEKIILLDEQVNTLINYQIEQQRYSIPEEDFPIMDDVAMKYNANVADCGHKTQIK